jgi:pimeloyl-ACP methyl ester carboxylesterase
MINVVTAILNQTIHDFPIDTSRISLAGISSGGAGCWELAMLAPERFSAVAPMASAGGDLARIKQLVGIPVWAFHSAYDRSTPIDGDRRTVDAVKAVGGQAYLTEIDSSDNDCWSAAFLDYDLLDWLLYQRRGQVSDYGPGTLTLKHRWRDFTSEAATFAATWKPLQILIQIGIPLILVLACLSAKKQRRNRRPSGEQTPA